VARLSLYKKGVMRIFPLGGEGEGRGPVPKAENHTTFICRFFFRDCGSVSNL
jgi:hypothetical protein